LSCGATPQAAAAACVVRPNSLLQWD